MNYFIPSWYGDHPAQWGSPSQEFQWGYHVMEFDDTINQVRMFIRFQEPTCLLTLGYFPGLRHLFHRQDLMQVKVHNLFDQMQGIPANQPTIEINYRDWDWPKDCEFVHSGAGTFIYRGNDVYAVLHYEIEGNLIQVERRQAGQPLKNLIFDDRGFLSSVEYFENGQFSHHDFLMPNGDVAFRLQADQSVMVMVPDQLPMQELVYPNIAAMVNESLATFADQQLAANDLVVVASNPQHSSLIIDNLSKAHVILSFFEDRNQTITEAEIEQASKANLLVVNADFQKDQLGQHGLTNVVVTPPFDSRLNLGTSMQEEHFKVLLLVEQLSDQELQRALTTLLHFMEQNALVDLIICTIQDDRYEAVKSCLKFLSQQVDWKYDYQFDVKEEDRGGNDLDDDDDLDDDLKVEQKKVRYIDFAGINSEPHLIEVIDPMRVVIDLAPHPNSYLQIAAISSGIPQINQVANSYVVSGKNGLILNDDLNLTAALHFYLDGLKNWNEALVYAVEKIGQYTSGQIVNEWLRRAGDNHG